MNIKQAKENVLKNLYAECEKIQSPRRAGKKTATIFNVGKFVENALNAIEKQTRDEERERILGIIESYSKHSSHNPYDRCLIEIMEEIKKL